MTIIASFHPGEDATAEADAGKSVAWVSFRDEKYGGHITIHCKSLAHAQAIANAFNNPPEPETSGDTNGPID